MKKLAITLALIALLLLVWMLAPEAVGQGRGRGAGGGVAAEQTPPTVFLGCVTGGNLQPVEQPFAPEPSIPFVLVDVLTRSDSGFSPQPAVPARPVATGTDGLPEIRATRVTSIWGTCPSPAALTPPPAKD
ncbi:MAG TPA: hypothetical protein VFR18_10990 [Terriglobia bacterium]|nr:hypothetical protein [Terriglobia bacterium]